MGAEPSLLRVVPDDRVDPGGADGLSRARARGGSALHHQDHGGGAELAGRDGRRDAEPGHRAHREGAQADRRARLHEELHGAGDHHGAGQLQGHDQAQGRAEPVLPGAQARQRHPERDAGRRAPARLRRRVRRRLRQHLRVHGRRHLAAPPARRGRARPLRGARRAQYRQGHGDRRRRRGDLSRFLGPQARGPGPEHSVARPDPAGPERRPAIRRRPGRAGAHLDAGHGRLRLRGQPPGRQSPGQRPLFSAERCRHHHARLQGPRPTRCSGSTASRPSVSASP